MAHSVQIPASPELSKQFAAELHASPPTKSFFHVKIVNEVLVLISSGEYTTNMNQVYSDIQKLAGDSEPSYFIIRPDPNLKPKKDQEKEGKKWTVVMFVPDNSKVKDKMVYAATFDTLKHDLGHNNFGRDHHFTSASEIVASSFVHDEKEVQLALTETEKLSIVEKTLERDSYQDSITKTRLMLPFDEGSLKAIDSFKSGEHDFIQFKLETQQEKIVFVSASKTRDLNTTQQSSPTFNLFRLHHQHPTTHASQVSIFFYFSCPDTSSAKEKMMGATVKPSIYQYLEAHGIKITKQFDTSDEKDDANETALKSLLHDTPSLLSVSESYKKGGVTPRKLIGGGSRKKLDGDDD